MKEAMPHWRKSHKCYYLHLRSTAFGQKKQWTVRLHEKLPESKKLRNRIMAGLPFEQGKSWKVWDGTNLTDLGACPDATIAAERLAASKSGDEPTENDLLCVVVLDKFLKHHREHSAAATLKFYEAPIESFKAWLPPGLRLSQLKVHHAEDWFNARHKTYTKKVRKLGDDGKPVKTLEQRGNRRRQKYVLVEEVRETSDTQKHNLLRAIKEPFTWALKKEHTTFCPLRGLEKPAQANRELIVSDDDWNTFVAVIPDREFQDVCWMLWDTGCRPQEVRIAQLKHFDRQGRRLVIPWEDAKCGKKTKRPRIVRLTDRAFAIVERLALKHPQGRLFRNCDGNEWQKDAFVVRFNRLGKRLKIKITAYAIRHTFATRCGIQNIHPKAAAELLGHVDTKMVDRVYSHLPDAHLHEQLKKLG